MIDIQSVIVYLGLPSLTFVFAKYAERYNSKKAFWGVALLLSFVAGLRATTVGIDTKTYDTVFTLISDGSIKSSYGIEKSFIYICAGLLRIWDNNQFLFFTFALISHGLVIFRLWKDRQHISFGWSVLAYYVAFFAFSLNGLRQFVAVAIVFWATDFIKNGKYVTFIISTIVASLFHTTALIGIAYIIFEIIFAKYLDSKRKIAIFLVISFSGIIGISKVLDMINLYSHYLERRATSIGIMMIIKILLLILSFVVIRIPRDIEDRYFCFNHRWIYFVGLILNSMGYIFLYVGRIGLYFYVYEAIYIGNLFKEKNRTIWIVLFKCIYMALLIYYQYINITRGAQGEMPYRFFWQTRSIY